jgi:demethylmenaquinone methyltransferase/2-methoxy-6-polyprenyl-1,4-benzoquinol methylase
MTVFPYKNNTLGKKKQVALMFDNISPRYDLLNHMLSFGIDRVWRRKAINLLISHQPKQILDIATGTGDFALQALKLNPDSVTGIDISEGMIKQGRQKINKRNLTNKIELLLGDSENLAFEDNKFSAVIVAFGVRNFENLSKGLSEMYRVLNKNGKVVILEFSKPSRFPFKQVYNLYFKYVLPIIGKMVSRDHSAYTYLPESVQVFPEGNDFLTILSNVGFKEVRCIPLTFGISSIYTGTKA